MKILFDQGVPVPLRLYLAGHDSSTAHEMGWSNLSNGDLLNLVEGVFDLFVTTDKNLVYQQNLKDITLSILVLPTTRWPVIREHLGDVLSVIEKIKPNSCLQLEWSGHGQPPALME